MAVSEKAFDKIRKCLELANSTNPNEAAVALKQAQGLMRKYGLEEHDIRLISLGKTTAKSPLPDGGTPLYLNHLICKIGEIYRSSPMESKNDGTAYVLFIGEGTLSNLAAYTFDVFSRKVNFARESFIAELDERTTKEKVGVLADAFCLGWVIEACSKIETTPLTPEEESVINEYADSTLDNVKDEAADVSGCDLSYGTYQAMIKGIDEARDVTLQTPIEGENLFKLDHGLW